MMSRVGNIGGRLYRGEVSFDFVNRRRLWYTISGAILLVSLIALAVRGLNFSVDFTGGAVFTFIDHAASAPQISNAMVAAGITGATVQTVGVGSHATWQVTTKTLTTNQSDTVQATLSHVLGISQNNVGVQLVGPSWGGSITNKAIEALIVFLVLVVIYLSIAFEWKMASAAFIALLHDIMITVGVYALTGFQVSPATITGLLTILGYSLYDTVVVFDKVRENTAGLLTTQKSTYSQAANLALNQTLVRSINTSLIALLPVASILFIGGGILGVGELNDLALVLFVGMLSGTYSSIFIATPVLAQLKEREPQFKALAARLAKREAGGRAARRAPARAGAGVAGAGVASASVSVASASAPVGSNDFSAERDRDVPDADGGRDAAESQAVGSAVPPADEPARQISRQQPRRNTAAQRRPSGGSRSSARKKRR
jgi:preprotein translocase subunit SecF